VSPADFGLLSRYELQASARFLLPSFAIRDCYRKIIPIKQTKDGIAVANQQKVDIYLSQNHQRAFYGNLCTCKSVWVCPICVSKITERRRQELGEALTVSSYTHLLLTYTLRHQSTDELGTLLVVVSEASRRFKNGKGWRLLRDRYGWVGDVRSLELTYGENGWHVHRHQLAFLSSDVDIEVFTGDFRKRWLACVDAQGFDASWQRGLDVRTSDGFFIGDYVGKGFGNWSIEHELTKATVKKGKLGGRTPRQLLVDYTNGDKQAGSLFQEYGVKLKGKNHMYWSLGLRKLLGLEKQKNDGEIMNGLEDKAYLLGSLSAADWWAVRRAGKRGELLLVARGGDFNQLQEYVASLRSSVGIQVAVG